MLTFIAVKCLTEIEWGALEDQYCFLYKKTDGKIVVLPEGALLVRPSASGAKTSDGNYAKCRRNLKRNLPIAECP